MKHKQLLTLGIALMALVGCMQDIEVIVPETSKPDGAIAINISGSITQTYTTRVDDGGFCGGDQVGIFGVNYTDNNATAGTLLDKGNQVDNARYTYDEENMKWTSHGNVYYKDAETNIDLYAYYPYSNVESVSAYKFEVAHDQSGANAIDGYAQSDFLWGKAENVTPTENKVKIKFNHKLACANVVLAEGDGFGEGEFESLDKGVLVMNTTRTAEVDLATGNIKAVGDAEREGIVMKRGVEGFRAIVVPQIVRAGTPLFSITVDGIGYRFKRDVDATYESGKQNKYTIKINKKKHSGDYEFVLTDTEIIDWIADLDSNGGEARQYYVVHCDEPGTLEQKLTEAKKDPAKIKNLKVSGKINATDFYFMRDRMDKLQAVNLKECEVVGDANGEGANEIPNSAFCYKYTLIYFEFPEKIVKINDWAFADCHQLSGALIIPNEVVEIGHSAFNGCSNISTLSLPIGLKRICDMAFTGCSSIAELNLPSTLIEIGSYAFASTTGGVNSGAGHMNMSGTLILPESLTTIGEGAFLHCSNLKGGITIPSSVTTIENFIFYGCSGLNGQLILHDGITKFTGETCDGISAYYTGAFNGCGFQGELKLPKAITEIPSGYFQNCLFSTITALPEDLTFIGSRAFSGNWRLMGTLEFPESLVSLGESAFSGCSNLEGIILPSDLGIIKSGAFNGCYYLNRIVCRATEPPILQGSVFDGVAKDNFTVEVPERSINRYQSASGWNEFKRIGAYYDFTISRRQMRVLNAEHSREFVLRAPANYAWSVESCPEWVTVTPSSGVGKVEVTVTVNEMTAADVGTFEINTGSYNSPNYETHEGRAGEVVFLLNDKDVRVKMSIEQYDYEYGDGDVIVNQTATVGNGVNLVFMGDCFDARDIAMGSYLDGINEAIGYYFDIEPYKTYRDYFNVYTVVGMSNDSGMGTVNTIRDAKFGSQYTLNAGVSPNTEITFEYAMLAETVEESNINKSLVIMVENTTDYGGVCYMWGDGSAIAICPMSRDAYPYDFRGIVQHEAGGHGFAKLGDEYIYHNAFISACPICNDASIPVRNAHSLGWYRNLALTGDMDEVAWSHLIFHPKYSNIVDIYEGGYMHSRGIFRSEPNSCMNNNIPYFSAISRQEAVERIKRYAGEEFDINDFYANDVLDMQGNKSNAERLNVESSIVISSGEGKQMPPRYMGDKPVLRK
ncbi:MAG: leucine-rich repeat protein [Alistipes sp.]|nr:leucine-rich repeat protein [Alistipes sp.]